MKRRSSTVIALLSVAAILGAFTPCALAQAFMPVTQQMLENPDPADWLMMSRTYDDVMPMFTSDGHFNRKGLEVLAKSFVDLHTLPTEPDISKLYTEAFLPPASK